MPALVAALQAVLDLHREARNDVDRTPPCPHCHGEPGIHECGCWADEKWPTVCAVCMEGTKGASVEYLLTVRAIEEALSLNALTDRIAAEHQPESGEWSVCICGQADLRYGRGIATSPTSPRPRRPRTYRRRTGQPRRARHDDLKETKRRTRRDVRRGVRDGLRTGRRIARGER